MIPDIDVSPELNALERSVLNAALGGEDSSLNTLRAQAAVAGVASRTPSGVGFMTKLRLPAEAILLNPDIPLTLPVVYAKHPHLAGGAEFLIQIKDGRINCIEAFCYEGRWPTDESLFEVDSC
jgi:hypothetical protein